MPTEKSLQQWCRKVCKEYDVLCYKFESPGRAGVPDLLLVSNGDVFFCELKSPTGTGRLSDLQKMTIAEVRRHGGRVYVVAGKGEFLRMLGMNGVLLTDKHRKEIHNQ